jgi:hypothetical protein
LRASGSFARTASYGIETSFCIPGMYRHGASFGPARPDPVPQ